MKITESPLADLLIIELNAFSDERGYFLEVYQEKRYAAYDIPTFVQDNISRSKYPALRGLHYQLPHPQGKLVWVNRGSVFDVVVDIRCSSPTFGKWFSITLSDENHLQLYIPPGFAHGFCALSDYADVHYKCTDFYTPSSERGILWNDSSLNINWPIKQPILSEKDKTHLPLLEIPHEYLFA